MSAPFSPGDRVVCVNDAPCPVHGKTEVQKGGVYRVVRACHGRDRCTGYESDVVLLDRHNPPPGIWHCADRFRHLRPNEAAAHESWSELLRNPQPEGVE